MLGGNGFLVEGFLFVVEGIGRCYQLVLVFLGGGNGFLVEGFLFVVEGIGRCYQLVLVFLGGTCSLLLCF